MHDLAPPLVNGFPFTSSGSNLVPPRVNAGSDNPHPVERLRVGTREATSAEVGPAPGERKTVDHHYYSSADQPEQTTEEEGNPSSSPASSRTDAQRLVVDLAWNHHLSPAAAHAHVQRVRDLTRRQRPWRNFSDFLDWCGDSHPPPTEGTGLRVRIHERLQEAVRTAQDEAYDPETGAQRTDDYKRHLNAARTKIRAEVIDQWQDELRTLIPAWLDRTTTEADEFGQVLPPAPCGDLFGNFAAQRNLQPA